MTEQRTTETPSTVTVSTPCDQAWKQAHQRASNYLKLHRLPAEEHDALLERVAQQMTRSTPCSTETLIQLFISTVQRELEAHQKTQIRIPTGPRFERSSIRVAPLRAITLLPRSAPRQDTP